MCHPTHECSYGFVISSNGVGGLAYPSLLICFVVNHSDSPDTLHVLCAGPPPRQGSGIAAFHELLIQELTLRADVSDVPLLTSSQPSHADDALHILHPWTWARFISRAMSGEYDAVLLTQWMPLTLPVYLSVVLGVRGVAALSRRPRPLVVLLLHDVRPDRWWPGAALLMRALLRLVDGATVLTPDVRRDALRLAPNLSISLRAHPVYDAYGPSITKQEARTALGLPDDIPVVLFFGHVKSYKGLDLLLEAFADIHTHTGAHLVVAGAIHPSAQSHVEGLISLMSRVDYITYRPGLVPDADVPHVFCAADVVALPYRRPASSGVLQIAAHYGRPVVAPRFDAFRETVLEDEVGVLFEAHDPADLAQAVVRALDLSPENVAQALENYRAEATWTNFVDHWLRFVKSRISPRSVT